MDTTQFQAIISFIWGTADLLRDVYVKGKYRDIILPMTIIRRLDCVLAPTKNQVLKEYEKYKSSLTGNALENRLCKSAGLKFCNYSKFTLESLLSDPSNIRKNFENYLNGFSSNITDIIEKFKFYNQLDTLEQGKILFSVIQKFCSPKVNFSINPVLNDKGEVVHTGLSNLGMGYVFEELIRKFNEENNEEAGEHFTPREIIQLMTHLVFLPIKEQIKKGGTYSIYDNACGSGGMLTESKEFIIDPKGEIQSSGNIYLYGQEINPETYAISVADILIKGEENAHIKFGSTLSDDKFSNMKFDFMLTNPPYGKKWDSDRNFLGIDDKKRQCTDPRFSVGITNKDDGQMMFLLNMLSKMQAPKNNKIGSRIASVHNSSPLFNSDSGQNAIRAHIIQNDYLEALIALPTDMFYNTSISTYIWILTNNKPAHKKGKIQLINATSSSFYSKMKKSLGKKSKEMTKEHIAKITKLFLDYENDLKKDCIVCDNDEFGYTEILIEKPKSIEILKEDERFLALSFKDEILRKLNELEANPKDFKDRQRQDKQHRKNSIKRRHKKLL